MKATKIQLILCRYEQVNYIAMSDNIQRNDWNVFFENKIVNEAYSIFQTKFIEICDKYIPTKIVVIRPNDKPFMNNNIR